MPPTNGRAKRSEKGLLTPDNCVVALIDHKGIQYVARDIEADQTAFDKPVSKWHSRSTATLVIAGEVIIGLNRNRARVEQLLT